MNFSDNLVRAAALAVAILLHFIPRAAAQPFNYNDATGDIAAGINTGGGTLDIVGMEVSENASDLVFTLTVNGNISTTDWGNFMIGIANTKLPGTTAPNGNGWGRPINMVPPSGTGMTHWIGSWVNGTGGSQLWTYNGASWTQAATGPGVVRTPGAQSIVQYTVSKASLSYEAGDVLFFDAYSSGSGGGDSAVDALSNPIFSIAGWGGPYTSGVSTGISRFPQASGVSANITFRVDMNPQIAAGNFNPAVDIVEVLPVGNAAFAKADMNEIPGQSGVYEVSVLATAPQDSTVSYLFNIAGSSSNLPESVNRAFGMPATATALPTVFFDNIQGYRNVTFRVDMNAPINASSFVPATQSVLVSGNFNSFSVNPVDNPPLTDVNADGIYEGTFTIGVGTGAGGSSIAYKFLTTAGSGTDSGLEFFGPNREATVELNSGGALDPAQVLPIALYGTPNDPRPVTFTVDMSLEVAAGRFDPVNDGVRVYGSFSDWATGGADFNLSREGQTAVYSGTFIVGGAPGSTAPYKFFNTAALNGGYEVGSDRTLTLGPVDQAQVLAPAVFGVTASQFRNVTFSVDMSVQVALNLFNPDETNPAVGGIVEVRGIAGFDSGPRLTREGTSLVYSGTFPVGGIGGSTFEYKFWSPGINFYSVQGNTGFEQIVVGDPFANRTVTLTAQDVAMNLEKVFFSNQLFYTTSAPLNAFNTTQGAASAAQSVTISGQGLTADIVATAPTGFEVSSNGINYGSTANIAPASGTVSAAALSVRIAGSAAVGPLSGNVTLTSAGSQPVNLAVTGTVAAAANGYSNWLTNYPSLTGVNANGTADPDGDGFNNNVEFSFDGNPTVGTPALMTVRPVGTNAVFNWVQRTSGVAYEVQKNTSLTNTWAEASGLSISNSTNQSGILIPADYIRREFIITNATGKDFYRVRATITGN